MSQRSEQSTFKAMSEEIKKVGPQAIDRYEDLSQIVRLLLGCMSKLEKATKQGTRVYWTQSVNHWIKQAKACLDNTRHFETPLTKHLAQELTDRIALLRKVKPYECKDLPIIADDLLYRVNAMIDSMTTVEAVRMSLVELKYIQLKETIATRINELKDESEPYALIRIDELKKLFPKPEQDERETMQGDAEKEAGSKVPAIGDDIAGQGDASVD